MDYFTLPDLSLKNKRLLIRSDLNVPIKNGTILDETRIKASLPTFRWALEHGAKSIQVLSHLGRPEPGIWVEKYSLKPVAEKIEERLHHPVVFVKDWIEGFPSPSPRFVLSENVRFLKGEIENDAALSQKMAAACDVFVMDAFGVAHRAHASTHGVALCAKEACAGLLLAQELQALQKVLESPKRPLVAIVGGAKISGKLEVLEYLLTKIECLILGGGMANTFLKALGKPIGRSLFEPQHVETAQRLLKLAEEKKVPVYLPSDVIVGQTLSENSPAISCTLDDMREEDSIFDIGPLTQAAYVKVIQEAKTLLWNGPLGVFEYTPFSHGTEAVALAIAESSAFKVAGGGETLSAIQQFHIDKQIDLISTGGGAFLEAIAGKPLPAVTALQQKFTAATNS